MRLPSGVVDQYIYFVAVDSTDFATRETGLSSFTVYRSRDGGAAAAMTTPTINETDATNMPGVYELLVDEDTTIAAGNDSEEMVLHITHAGMAPVTRTIELYRPKITAGYTLGVASDGDISGNVDGSVASVTGAVGSVTAAVTLPTIPSNWISASGIAASALDGKGDWNIGKTGYSLTQTFPTNFADLAITATTGLVTVGTNNDKTGYSISGTKTTLDALNDISTAQVNAECDTAISDASLATAAALATVDTNVDAILVDTGTTIPGQISGLNNLSAAQVNAEVDTALADIHLDHLLAVDYDPASPPGTATALLNELIESDAGVSRFTVNALENGPSGSGASAASIADAVWEEAIADHSGTSGSVAEQLAAAGASGDPWSTALPGAYGAGTAGKIVGDNLNAPVGTVDTVVDAIKAVTDNLPNSGTLSSLATAAALTTVDTVVDGIQTDLSNATDGLGAIKTAIDGLNDIAATDIVSNGAITTLSGAVVNVDLVDTCTTNTDMRGTDSAYTGTPPTASAIADAVLDEALSGHTTAGTLGKAVSDTESDVTAILADTADMQPKLGTPAADISADIAAVKSDTAAILIDTNELQGDWTNGGRLDLIIDAILADTGTDGVVLTAAERLAIADAILDRDMSTGADSGSPTVRTVRQALRFNRNKVSISGGTLTVTKEDDTTASWTASVTTTAGDPITTVDPA